MAIENMPSVIPKLLGLSFVTAFSGAIMPGPVLVATIEQTAIQGFTAVLGIITGHAVLELVLVICLMVGLHDVIMKPRVRAAIAIVGGFAMVLMGADMAINAFRIQVDLSRSAEASKSWWALMGMGVLLSLANPYFTGWWATIGTGQIAKLAPQTIPQYAAFYVGHEAGDYAWYGFVGALVITGRRWLFGPVYQATILLCAIAILLLGCWFLYSSWKLIRKPVTSQSAQ